MISKEFGGSLSTNQACLGNLIQEERRDNSEEEYLSGEKQKMSVLVKNEDDLVRFKNKYGYCGHNFDLPITWIDYSLSPNLVSEKIQKIFLKLFFALEFELETYRDFEITKKWCDFYDPNAKRHSRWLYRSVTSKKEFKKNAKKLDFFSFKKNQKFFDVAFGFYKNPKVDNKKKSSCDDKSYPLKFVAQEVVDYVQGSIS